MKGKSVVLGICGGIAAYKSVEVVSRLVKLGVSVDVIMTENAARFVAPLTFRSITHKPVVTDMFDEPEHWDVQHISLAKKADIFVIAPATANIIGKIACGIADDMLTTTVMAVMAPVLIVPSMNTNMYENPVVQMNIEKLKALGYHFMEPDTGRLAEGMSGKGRLPEPYAIVDTINSLVSFEKDFTGKRILVTAGPTREPIDPVRYITNRSSGKMGYAVAKAATERGAVVTLVSGPVSIPVPPGVEIVNVLTAEQMRDAVMSAFEGSDIIIMLAAVADYKCAEIAETKIKKVDNSMLLNLVKNPDILRELGSKKGSKLLIGACAETADLIKNASAKLDGKNLDMIIANDVTMEGAGFEIDTNIVKLIKADGSIRELPIMEKTACAHEILNEIKTLGGNGKWL